MSPSREWLCFYCLFAVKASCICEVVPPDPQNIFCHYKSVSYQNLWQSWPCLSFLGQMKMTCHFVFLVVFNLVFLRVLILLDNKMGDVEPISSVTCDNQTFFSSDPAQMITGVVSVSDLYVYIRFLIKSLILSTSPEKKSHWWFIPPNIKRDDDDDDST